MPPSATAPSTRTQGHLPPANRHSSGHNTSTYIVDMVNNLGEKVCVCARVYVCGYVCVYVCAYVYMRACGYYL